MSYKILNYVVRIFYRKFISSNKKNKNKNVIQMKDVHLMKKLFSLFIFSLFQHINF